jgi:hypothetical protein
VIRANRSGSSAGGGAGRTASVSNESPSGGAILQLRLVLAAAPLPVVRNHVILTALDNGLPSGEKRRER